MINALLARREEFYIMVLVQHVQDNLPDVPRALMDLQQLKENASLAMLLVILMAELLQPFHVQLALLIAKVVLMLQHAPHAQQILITLGQLQQ